MNTLTKRIVIILWICVLLVIWKQYDFLKHIAQADVAKQAKDGVSVAMFVADLKELKDCFKECSSSVIYLHTALPRVYKSLEPENLVRYSLAPCRVHKVNSQKEFALSGYHLFHRSHTEYYKHLATKGLYCHNDPYLVIKK